ncbi:hypothetical protein LKI01_19250 [Companilactobacillus paralimentarius]|nr:hypothetical protein LKI01_19250 [Companilactobacillus paralimentarius]
MRILENVAPKKPSINPITITMASILTKEISNNDSVTMKTEYKSVPNVLNNSALKTLTVNNW